MILVDSDNYVFVRFEKSKLRNKKYDAVLMNKYSNQLKRVSFGHKGYQQYKDSTGLNLYSKLDHKDKERRRLYYARHGFCCRWCTHRWSSAGWLEGHQANDQEADQDPQDKVTAEESEVSEAAEGMKLPRSSFSEGS